MPRVIPEPRYFSIPSVVVGGIVFRNRARNCTPWVRSADGWRPSCVRATGGTTSTPSIDPVAEIAPICRDFGLWLHVDGAYGGMAAIVPEMRHVLDGCQGADSIVINPHKWLFTPLDCSALYVRDPDALQRSFSLVPEYLKSREEDVTNYSHSNGAWYQWHSVVSLWKP